MINNVYKNTKRRHNVRDALTREVIQTPKQTDLRNIKRPIVFACDEAYAMPLATAIRSIVEHNRDHPSFDFVILTEHFSPKMRQRVAQSLPSECGELYWVPITVSSFKEFSTQPYISQMTYARLLIPNIFANNVTRVLYLDADILVLGDLKPLWELNLENAVVGAVVDTYSASHSQRLQLGDRPWTSTTSDNLGSEMGYFNAGVLLVDLPRWRQERISEQAFEYLVENPETLLSDQDALNVACVHKWKALNDKWNLQDHDAQGYVRIVPQKWPVIAHFAGRFKPWEARTLNVNSGFYDIFRRRTEFARTRRDRMLDGVRYRWAWFRQYLRQHEWVSSIRTSMRLLWAGRQYGVAPMPTKAQQKTHVGGDE